MQRCQARDIEEETAEHAAVGKSKPSAVISSSDEAVDETETDASQSRSRRSCKEIILRHETTQSRRKLNSERSEAPRIILETWKKNKEKKGRNEETFFEKKKREKEASFFEERKWKRWRNFYWQLEVFNGKDEESFFEREDKQPFTLFQEGMIKGISPFEENIVEKNDCVGRSRGVSVLENSEKLVTISFWQRWNRTHRFSNKGKS